MVEEIEQITLTIIDADGVNRWRINATLSEAGDNCQLSVGWPLENRRQFVDADFYECLRAFRRVLDVEGYRVLCEGARPNVFPSPMARGGGGLKAYALTHGQQSFTKDLVNIFDPIDDPAIVGSVEQQDAFVESHFAALRSR